jgi:O-antigen/teichoic acid export membrane protein
MKASVVRWLDSVGIDKAVLFTISSRGVQAGGALFSIFLVSIYLTKAEQGYYFTFGSVLAIQVFFELGLSSIIAQYVAHEVAHVSWDSSTEISGSVDRLSRLSSLLHFFIKWFAVSSVLLFFILLSLGIIFFTKFGKLSDNVSWLYPWIVITFSTSCLLFMSPFMYFLEGLGKVKEVAKIRLLQQALQILILVLSLTGGLRLFSSPLANLLSMIVLPTYLYFSKNKTILENIWKKLSVERVNYRKEIFPMQWRIALSWSSGYFMYQLFNPIIFAHDGPVAAGQMGITLAVLNGILTIALSWINTKIPLYSTLIARNQFSTLDSIFYKTLKQVAVISLLMIGAYVSVVYYLQSTQNSFGSRFLEFIPLLMLSLTTYANLYISSLAIYLRCHKEEPLLQYSLVMAILTGSSTVILGYYYGVIGITAGYSFLTLFVGLVWATIVFNKKRILWHNPISV